MKGSADERSQVDRRDEGDDAARDTREEYTSYREGKPERPADDEATREANLQPSSPEERKEH